MDRLTDRLDMNIVVDCEVKPQIKQIKLIAKTLIRLWGCTGLSESLLGAYVILLVLLWSGSWAYHMQMFTLRSLISLQSAQTFWREPCYNNQELKFHLDNPWASVCL